MRGGCHHDAADVLGKIALERHLTSLERPLDERGRCIDVGAGRETVGSEILEGADQGADRARADRRVARHDRPARKRRRHGSHEIEDGTGITDVDDAGRKLEAVFRGGYLPDAGGSLDGRAEGFDDLEAGKTVGARKRIPDRRCTGSETRENAGADRVALRAGNRERARETVFSGNDFHCEAPF